MSKPSFLFSRDDNSPFYNPQQADFTRALIDLGMTKGVQVVTSVAVLPGNTLTPKLTNGCTFYVTLDANLTVAAPSLVRSNNATVDPGTNVRFVFVQDATGSRTVTWNGAYGSPMALTPAALSHSIYDFILLGDGTLMQPRAAVIPGRSEPTTADIRDFASNVMNNNATADTTALVAAAAFISSNSDSSSPRPGKVKFPRGNLTLTTPLTIYGSSSTASCWEGVNGRSRGPDGTVIQWGGGNTMSPMLHLLGMNASLFKDFSFNALQDSTHAARFCIWSETNQRNGGAASSGMQFENIWYTGWGHLGAGHVFGDEVRSTLTLTGVSGNFVPGEFVIDNLSDGVATVGTWDGSSSLYIQQLIGSSFTTVGSTITGVTSGATGTISVNTIDPAYQGNLEFSEARWVNCGFQGTQIVDITDIRAGWAGLAAFGGNNNKNYTVVNPVFDGSRYGIDTGIAGSGFFRCGGLTASDIGHNGAGWLMRFGGGQVSLDNPEFENGASNCRSGFLKTAASCVTTVIEGEMYGLLPADNYAIKNSGILNMFGTHLGADSGNAQIQTGGLLGLYGVGWRENFSGSLPLYDGSNNPLGLNGNADFSRNNDSHVIAQNCVANAAGNVVKLPDLYLVPLSPSRNQLNDNGITNNTVVQRGRLSCSDEIRTITFTNVKAQSGSNDIALTPAKAIIRGVVLDLTQVFLGGSIASVTMSVGIDTNHTKYLGAQDVFTATGQFTTFTPALAPWAGDNLKAFFAFTGAAVSALTQGSVTIYILYEKL